MEENNEMALAEFIDTSILQPTLDFDFQARGFSKEIEDDILVMRCENNEADANNILVKGRNFKRVKEYCKSTNNEDVNFEECMEKVFNTKAATSKKYIMAYDTLMDIKKKVSRETFEKILQLGIHKISYFAAKIPENTKIKMLEDAPLQELNVEQTRQLTNEVKKTGEYNETLLDKIRQNDEKIKKSEEQQKQLQQEKEQKDQEIAELKARLQKMEEEKTQPVESSEPEVVEKVVEKEVIPDEIQEELKTLKQLVKEKNEIPEHIKNELFSLREQVAEKDALLNDAKDTIETMATATNSKFGTQRVDWNLLGDIVSHFLGGASEYSYMETVYKEETSQKKNYIKSQVDRVEKWVLQMKQMMNESLMIGNTIYDNVDFEVENIKED